MQCTSLVFVLSLLEYELANSTGTFRRTQTPLDLGFVFSAASDSLIPTFVCRLLPPPPPLFFLDVEGNKLRSIPPLPSHPNRLRMCLFRAVLEILSANLSSDGNAGGICIFLVEATSYF